MSLSIASVKRTVSKKNAKKLELLTAIFVLSIGIVGCQSARKSDDLANGDAKESQVKHIDVQGHRGARTVFPENSLPAFQYALEIGVDTIELDMGVTKDNVVVVSHDPWISKSLCVDSKGRKLKEDIPLRFLTYEQVKAYICGTLPHERFPNQKKMSVYKPTLEEVFQLIQSSKLPSAKTVQFNIETKLAPAKPEIFATPEEFARLVLEVVRKFGFEDRVILQSFDHRTLVAMKKLEPRIRLAPLFEGVNMRFELIAKDLGAQYISPEHIWITKENVQRAQALGLKVVPWTANSAPEWDRLLSFGVDGIITDDPGALLEHLNVRKLR